MLLSLVDGDESLLHHPAVSIMVSLVLYTLREGLDSCLALNLCIYVCCTVYSFSMKVWKCLVDASASVFSCVLVGQCLDFASLQDRVLCQCLGLAHTSEMGYWCSCWPVFLTLRSFTEPYPWHVTWCVGVWRLIGIAWDIPVSQM